MSERTTTRAGALRRLGLLLGGAGLGAAGGFAAHGDTGRTAAPAVAGDGVTRLRLRAPQLAYVDPDATPTSFMQIPSRLVGAAKLTDDTGRMSGAFTGLRMPAGNVELHTFTLDGGTLMGMGPASGSDFSVVGGTGQYIGATGAYTMEHRAASAGGDGSADFVIDITRRELSWH